MQQCLVSALVAIALFLLAGCGGNFGATSAASTSQGVMFISKQAPLMVSFLSGWQKLQSQPQIEKSFKTFLGKQNLDYKKDIQPWLGSEVTLAITDLDFDHEASNGVQPGYLLTATTKDGAKSREFLQTLLSQQLIGGTELTFDTYKGTQLIYAQVSSENLATNNLAGRVNLASAVVGDRFVLLANHPQVLRQAINNAQAVELSLAYSPNYLETIGSLDQSRLGLGFINLPAFTAWLGKHGELTQEPPFASLALALSQQNQGLVATTALTTGNLNHDLDNNSALEDQGDHLNLTTNSPVGNYLPAKSGLAIAGTDLQNFLAPYLAATEEPNLLQDWLSNLLKKVDSNFQLDLQQDIGSWLTGDYALGWLPSQSSGQNSSQNSSQSSSGISSLGDWIFIADRSASKAQEAIAHLDQIATDQGFSLTPLKLAQQPVTLWTQLQTKTTNQGLKDINTLVKGVHATVGDYEIFTSSMGAMGSALGMGSEPLLKDRSFQGAIAPLTTPNQGYIYLDWATARPLLESQFPFLRLLEVPLNPWLENLGTLSFTSYGTKAGITSSELFLKFKQSSQ